MAADLTRESVETMEEGPEMDALVAELVMGWHRGKLSFLFYDDAGKEVNNGWRPEESGDYYACSNQCEWFQPSTNIAAAWTVLEKMRGQFQVTKCRDDYAVTRDDHPAFATSAPAAPLAICRAALLSTLSPLA